MPQSSLGGFYLQTLAIFWTVQEKEPRVADFKLAFLFLGFDMKGKGDGEALALN